MQFTQIDNNNGDVFTRTMPTWSDLGEQFPHFSTRNFLGSEPLKRDRDWRVEFYATEGVEPDEDRCHECVWFQIWEGFAANPAFYGSIRKDGAANIWCPETLHLRGPQDADLLGELYQRAERLLQK